MSRTQNDSGLGRTDDGYEYSSWTPWYPLPLEMMDDPMIPPWWWRWEAQPQHPYDHRGGWVAGYPTLGPYYPMTTPNLEYLDPWSLQFYHGYWW